MHAHLIPAPGRRAWAVAVAVTAVAAVLAGTGPQDAFTARQAAGTGAGATAGSAVLGARPGTPADPGAGGTVSPYVPAGPAGTVTSTVPRAGAAGGPPLTAGVPQTGAAPRTAGAPLTASVPRTNNAPRIASAPLAAPAPPAGSTGLLAAPAPVLPPVPPAPGQVAPPVLGAVVPPTGPAPTVLAVTPPVRPATQGALPPSGCTVTGTAASCQLFAGVGTIVLPGQPAPVPVWGFAGTATAPVSTPGPVLVVDQGATVTITVHNGLTEPLSLTLPSVTGFAADRTGAAPGAAVSYTFTAARPGTYLYEAGHTPEGARQAAMGLIGALVVRAPGVLQADGVTVRPSLLGTAATGYDDEAVLVLSEIDPALAANPLAFDMRGFSPRYRLINGKAYPETAHIATDPGRQVLLRYVNAGTTNHTMGLLGTGQTALARDARPVGYPVPAVAETLVAGESVDSIVSVPTGADGVKYALYDTSGALATNGQLLGTTGQVAFGGMLTYLDTQAAPPTGDRVGPAASAVTVAPGVAKVTDPLTLAATFSDVRNGNSSVVRAEYVIDNLGIAEGSGQPFDMAGIAAAPTLSGLTATINLAAVVPALAEGKHMVYVRAQDSAGNWGAVGSVGFTLALTGPATTGPLAIDNPTNGESSVGLSATADDRAFGGTITAAEYFIDRVRQPGEGQDMKFTEQQSVTAVVATVGAGRMRRLTEGHHTVFIHSQDSLGLWGPMATIDLVVDKSGPAMTTGAVLPSPNNGTLGSPVDTTMVQVQATFADPTVAAATSPVVGAEGFIDVAGAPGTGFVFYASDGTWNSTTEAGYGLIPLSEFTRLADGNHQVLVRALDAAGNWGPLGLLTLAVDRTPPVASGLSAALTTVGTTTSLNLNAVGTDTASAVTAAEWFDGGDPGAGNGKPMSVTATGPTTATVSTSVDLTTGFTPGPHRLSVRVRDAAGNWSPAVSTVVTVQAANLVFSDGFERGNTSAWTAGLGRFAVTEAAALAGTYGLAVTGYGNTLPSYLVTASPTAEPSYHARFLFRAGTLTNPGSVNLFAARTITGANAVVVQYRTVAGSPEVRLGVLSGTAMTYSPWAALPTAAVSVQVDWSADPSGGAQLRVGGTVVGSLIGLDTSAVRVETAWLGLSGATAASSGTASFDAFISARYILP